ncbi:hypothetical protein BT96DRAFT_916774, partial [Gymnopus androsaceus JB14]
MPEKIWILLFILSFSLPLFECPLAKLCLHNADYSLSFRLFSHSGTSLSVENLSPFRFFFWTVGTTPIFHFGFVINSL